MRHLAVTAYCMAATVLTALAAAFLYAQGALCICSIAAIAALAFALLTVHEARRGWPAFQIERRRSAANRRREAQMRRCPADTDIH